MCNAALEVEQELFSPEPSPIPAQIAARCGHTMTGEHQGERVLCTGCANRPRRARVIEHRGNLAIRRGLGVGDARERSLHPLSKTLTGQVECDGERAPLAGEVLLDLLYDRRELLRSFRDDRVSGIRLGLEYLREVKALEGDVTEPSW